MVGDVPFHVGLTHVWDLMDGRFEGGVFVVDESAFPVGEVVEFVAGVGECCAALLDVLFAAAHPCAFTGCEDVGIDVVHAHDGVLVGDFGVAPCGGDCSGDVGVTLGCSEDC